MAIRILRLRFVSHSGFLFIDLSIVQNGPPSQVMSLVRCLPNLSILNALCFIATSVSLVSSRADLQNAIESENYSLAAELRDEISKLESESLAASVKAQAHENAQYAFRLGQKVKHEKFGKNLTWLYSFVFFLLLVFNNLKKFM